MCKKILLSIVAIFGFMNITAPKINAATHVEQNVKLTPVLFIYGDPCSSYGFRLRHPEQCYIDDYVEYDSGISLFPFFGGGSWGHGHHGFSGHGGGHHGSGISSHHSGGSHGGGGGHRSGGGHGGGSHGHH